MLSIITCSRSDENISRLKKSIEETVGVTHEIICIDNHENNYNIFQAYNAGVKQAIYPLVCFVHDDILFHTDNWGQHLIEHFKDEQVGMVGVAGPRFLSHIPGIWWGGVIYSGVNDLSCQYNIDTDRNDPTQSHHTHHQPLPEVKIEVAILDGLFFCIKKELFNSIAFDENNFDGFHFYDLDISMQVRSCGYKVFSVYDILVEHISVSNINKTWVDACRIFYNKWGHVLPVETYPILKKDKKKIEFSNFKTMVRLLKENNQSVYSFFKFKELLFVIIDCFDLIVKDKIKK